MAVYLWDIHEFLFYMLTFLKSQTHFTCWLKLKRLSVHKFNIDNIFSKFQELFQEPLDQY